jgi:hypothetical protein
MTPDARLALLVVAVWSLGATFAAHVGVWIGVGSVAVALGAFVLARVPAVRARLRPRPRDVAAGAAAALLLVAGTYALSPVLGRSPWFAQELRALYGAFQAAGTGAAAVALAPVVLGEELAWRGVVQEVAEQRVGRTSAAVLTAVAYALAHAPTGSSLLVVTALGCGLVWGWLRAATGSLVPSVVCHLIWDVVVLLLFPLAPA